jgi:hypothetical protein
MAIKGDIGNVSTRQIAINLLSIFDLFVGLAETKWGKQFKKTSGHTVESFISNCPGYSDPEVGGIINTWIGNDTHIWSDYSTMTRNGGEVQRKAQGEIDVLGKVSLQTYSNKNILDTTQSIIAKRINAFEAVTSLRFDKFANLVRDIFNRLPGYVSGSIKVSKDFDKLVDDLYIAEIYSIAAYSAFFYDSEIDRLMGAPQTQTSSNQTLEPMNAETQRAAALMSSLDLLSIHKSTSVLKESGTVAAIAAGLAATGITASVINYLKKRPYDPGFMNFIEKGIINTKIGDDIVKGDIVYNIGEIQKIQTQEARQLIQKLQNIAQYTKKTTGVKDRLGYAQQAGQAIWGVSGHSLYGGPR